MKKCKLVGGVWATCSDNNLLYVGGNGSVSIFNNTLELVKKFDVGTYTSVAINDTDLLVGLWDGSIQIYDIHSLTRKKIVKQHTDWIQCLLVWKERQLVISASFDESIQVWDTQYKCITTLTNQISVFTLLLHDNVLYSGSGKTVRVWNTSSWSCTKEIECRFDVYSLTEWNNKLIVGMLDGGFSEFNIGTFTLKQTIKSHPLACNYLLVFNNYLYSASYDNTVKVHNSQFECVATFEGHTAGVRCLSVFQDKYLVSGSAVGMLSSLPWTLHFPCPLLEQTVLQMTVILLILWWFKLFLY